MKARTEIVKFRATKEELALLMKDAKAVAGNLSKWIRMHLGMKP